MSEGYAKAWSVLHYSLAAECVNLGKLVRYDRVFENYT
jgi:hypothetical protein